MDISTLNRKQLKLAAKTVEKESKKYPDWMTELPGEKWGETALSMKSKVVEVWRSKFFLCQVYEPKDGMQRLSICRCAIDVNNGRWTDRITWEELQNIKAEVGRGDLDAVEIYPKDSDIVNVANFRHLWVYLDSEISFAWRRPCPTITP